MSPTEGDRIGSLKDEQHVKTGIQYGLQAIMRAGWPVMRAGT